LTIDEGSTAAASVPPAPSAFEATIVTTPPLATASPQPTTPSATDTAKAAVDKAPAIAREAADHTKDVASEAAGQAKVVVGQAKDHVQELIGQARGEVASQVETRSKQAAVGLRSLSGQLGALRDGRPQEAGSLTSYLSEAEQRVGGWARRLEDGGAQGAMDDLTRFARRRPGLFLAGALSVGFVVGRVARSGVAVAKEQHESSDGAAERPIAFAAPDPFLDAPLPVAGEPAVPFGAVP